MRLREDKIRRIAERLHDELAQKNLLAYKDPAGSKTGVGRALRVKAIYDFIVADLAIESEIDAEAERVLATYQRELRATERDILFRKHKEEIAHKRGYIL